MTTVIGLGRGQDDHDGLVGSGRASAEPWQLQDSPWRSTSAVCSQRELSRGGRRKNYVIDASAAASVAALHGDATRVTAEDDTTVFALLEERRANLAAQRVRAVNQLHALMRDLIPGGARNALMASAAAKALRGVVERLPRSGPARTSRGTSYATSEGSTSASLRSPDG
jgi:hypothetical protein